MNEYSNNYTIRFTTIIYNVTESKMKQEVIAKTICLQLGLQGSMQSGPICTINRHTHTHTHTHTQHTHKFHCSGYYTSSLWGWVSVRWSTDSGRLARYCWIIWVWTRFHWSTWSSWIWCSRWYVLRWINSIKESSLSELRLDLYLMWSTWRLMMQSLSSLICKIMD